MKIDKVYVSKLSRAKDTFKEIKKHLGKVPVKYTGKVNEHNMGIYAKQGKDDWDKYRKTAEKSHVGWREFVPKDGESLEQMWQRVGEFYSYLMNEHIEDIVLIVSHGYFLQYLIMQILGIEVVEHEMWKLSNASVSEFDIDKQGNIKDYHINGYNHLIEGGMMQ